MPVVRYKTGDKIEIIPHSGKIKFRLVGRVDDMVYIWGARISLSVIKNALYSSGLDNELPFQICLSTSKNAVDNLKITTEKLISKDTFVKELFILSEDIRNTLTPEHVLANLTVQANDKFLKTKKTGKTPQILDLR
jgi:phenylacetate-coenzyme A ligase PaaK-like adenylate-forming protein